MGWGGAPIEIGAAHRPMVPVGQPSTDGVCQGEWVPSAGRKSIPPRAPQLLVREHSSGRAGASAASQQRCWGWSGLLPMGVTPIGSTPLHLRNRRCACSGAG